MNGRKRPPRRPMAIQVHFEPHHQSAVHLANAYELILPRQGVHHPRLSCSCTTGGHHQKEAHDDPARDLCPSLV